MSSFTLKIIALILMFIDHIGVYFDTPTFLRIIGRSSYPLFLFCMVWSYHYTRDRKKYLLRLYLFSIFMTVFSYTINARFPTEYGFGNHNIFLSMFIVGVLISTIELFIKDRKKGYIALGIITLVQIFYYIAPTFLPFIRNLSGDITTGIIPNISLNEYGFEFVALGVLMYFLKEKKEAFIAMYIIFCLQQFSSEMLMMGTAIQWMMIAALPLMLKYNNQKGPSMKYFFYIFYPAHTFALYYISNFILK